MKVVVHDFSGHPFQVQLSRELARRGHDVVHSSCAAYVSGR
ncbi:MAG: glycosyltransferase WbuB, partial [Actinomycetales bacterium]